MFEDPKLNPRAFYRQCKEKIDFYLNTINKEDYHIIYKLVGPDDKFVELKETDAAELAKIIRNYFIVKMNQNTNVR